MRYFDLGKIEQDKELLSDSEMEVKSNISHDPREAIYNGLDLEEALKTLSKRQRECFELVVKDGYTEAEVARKLGIAQQVVDRRVAKAKEKIRNFLQRGVLKGLKVPNTYGGTTIGGNTKKQDFGDPEAS